MTAYRISDFDQHPLHPFFFHEVHDHPFFQRAHRYQNGFRRQGGERRGGGCEWFRFLKQMAFVILSLFFVMSLVRFAFLMLAMLFSPPMLFLFLVAFIVPLNWGSAWSHQSSCPFSSWSCSSNNGSNRNFQGNNCFSTGRRCCNNNGCVALREVQRAQQDSSSNPGDDNNEFNSNRSEAEDTTKDNRNSRIRSSSNLVVRPTSKVANRQPTIIRRDETEKAVIVSLDVPGFAVENFQISVTEESNCRGGNSPIVAIEVHGERQNRLGETFVVHERFLFLKEKYEVDAGVSANLVDGVLEIRVNKKPPQQPRLIPISIEKKDI